MTHTLAKFALITLPFLCIAGNAHALAQNSTSNKYFDENGTLVGQQIRLCNALSYHAGNVHSAYMITEEVPCGANPSLDYIVPGTIITAYTLPGSQTISNACGIAECSSSGVAEPTRLMNKGWTWLNFWQ
ncbi:hypothetical protein EC912_101798 [Luteibacter rhizovicinus]|uniref:Uncharacterized protein n=1 Tax=Luteibacter rhizovicinus TaxID=242606 RepID=A0A4R3YYE3_9GAMM|nr:hypothetical protein [Luteibacter rhizovicinus]TCV97781.1 hypothetical protein EC912_101798 [Luteibacter rhizovicinus]